MQPQVEVIIKKIATKYGLPYDGVYKLLTYPFKFASEKISEEVDVKELHYPHIRIPVLGIFYVPTKRINFWKRRKNEVRKVSDKSNDK